MMFKMFYFVGVVGMSIIQGVLCIKEIINVFKMISMFVIICVLENIKDVSVVWVVKYRIEKIYIKDIFDYVDDVWLQDVVKIVFRFEKDGFENLEQIGIMIIDIVDVIVKVKKFKLKIELEDLKVNKNVIEVFVYNIWQDVMVVRKVVR